MATYIYEPKEGDLELRPEDLEMIQEGWEDDEDEIAANMKTLSQCLPPALPTSCKLPKWRQATTALAVAAAELLPSRISVTAGACPIGQRLASLADGTQSPLNYSSANNSNATAATTVHASSSLPEHSLLMQLQATGPMLLHRNRSSGTLHRGASSEHLTLSRRSSGNSGHGGGHVHVAACPATGPMAMGGRASPPPLPSEHSSGSQQGSGIRLGPRFALTLAADTAAGSAQNSSPRLLGSNSSLGSNVVFGADDDWSAHSGCQFVPADSGGQHPAINTTGRPDFARLSMGRPELSRSSLGRAELSRASVASASKGEGSGSGIQRASSAANGVIGAETLQRSSQDMLGGMVRGAQYGRSSSAVAVGKRLSSIAAPRGSLPSDHQDPGGVTSKKSPLGHVSTSAPSASSVATFPHSSASAGASRSGGGRGKGGSSRRRSSIMLMHNVLQLMQATVQPES